MSTTSPRPIRRLLIANRGEIACRIARTCAVMGIETVAVYADGEAGARHVRVTDMAVRLPGVTAAETYLDPEAVIAAAHASEADAVHPGYGFLSERASFAEAVTRAGLLWVGPPSAAIAAMGDKISAKQLMRDAGVPVLPSVTDPAEAATVGYPLIVKAAAGGGGKGMRIVNDAAALNEAVAAAQREAAAAFGDDRVFLERYIQRPRHIEVQILADAHGAVLHLGERECSVQRRHQKVIEEAPSPAVDEATRARLGQAAVAAAAAVDYVGAGTVEFVATQPSDGAGPEFSFLEMNTRLQVEHPVTELAWARADGVDLDLVRLQLEVAEGRPLPFSQEQVHLAAHAVEARLYAEDPAAGFLPATGTVELLERADGPGTRWDSGVETGDVVGPHFDPMLAKVIASGQTRSDALRRLSRELSGTRLHGLRTNRDALVAMLEHPDMTSGALDTGFIDRLPSRVLSPDLPVDARLLHLLSAALVGRYRRATSRTVQTTIPPGWRNNRSQDDRVVFTDADGAEQTVAFRPGPAIGTWVVQVDDHPPAGVQVHHVTAESIDLEVTTGDGAIGRRLRVDVSPLGHQPTHGLAADTEVVWGVDSPLGASRLIQQPRFPQADGAVSTGGLAAPMPGSVLSVAVAAGDEVAAGDLIMVIEAMKMEHRITAPDEGTVAAVRVVVGDQVHAGDVLAVIA